MTGLRAFTIRDVLSWESEELDERPHVLFLTAARKSPPPPDWKTYRRRWDLLHCWRAVLLTIAFAFLILGFVSK